MTELNEREQEALESYRRYVAQRELCVAGTAPWSTIGEWFTEDAVFIEDTLSYMEPPYWYYPVRQSLGAIKLRQGKLDEAEKAFRDSLARVRNNGWVLSALVETYDKKKDKKAKEATQAAFKRTWFGGKAPELARL